jgi:hypothetical protein
MRCQSSRIDRMIDAGTRCGSRPSQLSCGSERPTSVMLWKEKAARSGYQPHVKIEQKFMSNMDTRRSIIVGVR